MKQRQCLKCGHLNEVANGGDMEACPKCGAIYTKVQRALNEQRATEAAKAAAEESVRAAAAEKAAAQLAISPPPIALDRANESAAQKKAKSSFGNSFWMIVLFVVTASFFWSSQSGRSNSANSSTAGAVVSNSGWDGSVRQVERYLKNSLKDPGSYEAIEWSTVVTRPDGSFMVRVKYRARNSFGGYVVEERIFTLDAQGNVTGSSQI